MTPMTDSERVEEYLATLRRVPPPVILSVATREIDMGNPHVCLCGWAVRDALLFAGKEWRATQDTDIQAHDMFGGSAIEWERLFVGFRLAEEAFARRVAECVR